HHVTFFYDARPHRHLHSFPTRRSSDLTATSSVSAPGGTVADRASGPMRAFGCRPSSGNGARFFRPDPPLFRRLLGPRRPCGHLLDRKSTRLNSSHVSISYAVFCLKKKK